MVAYDNVVIAPSLLASDFTKLGEEVATVAEAGAEYLHIDVMDGHFVPNITMGPLVVRALRPITDLVLDVHLMIVEPEKYLETFAEAGADIISVHIEASPHLHRTLQQIRSLGCKAGVAINPHTPASAVAEIIDMVDLINVMTVNPGFGGQSFIMSMTSKIEQLRAMVNDGDHEIDIEVDGGINAETAQHAVQAGANVLVAGSAVFKYPDGAQSGIKAIRDSLKNE